MSEAAEHDSIRIRGARTHNLHNVSLEVPRGKLVVFTGPSGSGKSSLVFDTIFAEGQRRFLATLPNLPDRFHPRRPPVDAIEGLPPVLSVSQSAGVPRPRSTLATLTQIHDHLRLLWARRGTPYCPDCGIPIVQQSLAQISRAALALPVGTKIYLMAPLVHETPGRHVETFREIQRGGFLRARVDGVLFEIRDTPDIDENLPHTIDLVVDRLVVREGIDDRLAESLAACARSGDGRVIVSDVEETGDWNDTVYSTKLSCPKCRRVLPELEPRRFHFNTPHGACPGCGGLGVIAVEGSEDDTVICPDCRGARLNREARAVRYAGVSMTDVTAMTVDAAAQAFDAMVIDPAHPLAEVERTLRREISTRLRFLGEVGLGYLTLDRPASTLSGGELQRARLATQLGGGLRGVCFILDEPTLGLHPRDTERLLVAIRSLQDRGNSLLVVEHDEAMMRAADYLVDLGPGAGPDGGHILAAGTVAEVVTSEASVTARYLTIGANPQSPLALPGRGAGGEGLSHVPNPVAFDDPDESSVAARDEPLTPNPSPRRGEGDGQRVLIRGARHHNLKNLDVALPLGRLVAVTGVSGSGKSSLVLDVLARAVRRHLGILTATPGEHDGIDGLEALDKLIEADHRPIGRSSRSSAATYTGLFDELRKLFARTRTAKMRGYSASRFSFNAKGGRCETCQGHGELRPGGSYLPELSVPCPACEGRRFNPGTLEVRFKGHSIADVLAMPVAAARDVFAAVPNVARVLAALGDVGLGYLPLGQPATQLSGGEAQRVKLAAELARTATGRTLIILDEPTSGLHRVDIDRLLNVLRKLVLAGNTVVVIEHHPAVIAASDWVVDLGPGAGELGGRLMASGSPGDIAANSESVTGRYVVTNGNQ